MARRTIPLIEVTGPDGTKSLWAAYAVPHQRAVAAVQARLPPGHIAQLAGRRLPRGSRLEGVLRGDVIRIEYDAISRRAVSFTSARSASLLPRIPEAAVEDFDEMAAQLLAAVRKMPAGQKRQDALREIGRLRSRIAALLQSAANSSGSKSKQSSSTRRTASK